MLKSSFFDVEFFESQFGSPEEYRLFVEDEINVEIENRVKKYYFDWTNPDPCEGSWSSGIIVSPGCPIHTGGLAPPNLRKGLIAIAIVQ